MPLSLNAEGLAASPVLPGTNPDVRVGNARHGATPSLFRVLSL